MAKRSELQAAYAATRYRLFLPDGHCDLRVGQPSALMVDWLKREDMSSFALLTAYNPASRLLSDQENRQRQAALWAEVEQLAQPFAVGENVAEAADWPVEASLCILGLRLSEACALGRKYGQNALLFGTPDGVPHLHWIEETGS
jgi:hypothetical protein